MHHGNGTEETVRWLTPGVDQTEITSPYSFGSIAVPRFKPWFDQHDAENVLFVSVHGYGPRERGMSMPLASFYPGTGPTKIPDLGSLGYAREAESEISSEDGGDIKDSMSDASNHDIDKTMVVDNGVFNNDSTKNSNDAEEGDDDDEEDSDFNPEEVRSRSSDDSGENRPPVSHSAGSTSHPYLLEIPRVRKLYSVYQSTQSSAAVSSETNSTKKQRTAANAYSAQPFILDVGVGLPAEGLNPQSYRNQWRNYFR